MPHTPAPTRRRTRGTAGTRRLGRPGPVVLVAFLVLAAIVLLAVFGPMFLGDPNHQDLHRTYLAPAWLPGGTWTYPAGTDQLGRDMLSRVVAGLRVSLEVALLSTLLSTSVGVALGVVAGWRAGWADQVIMRLIDVEYTIPGLILIVVLEGLIRPGVVGTATILALGSWLYFARIIRPEVTILRDSEFMQALVASGISRPRMILRHLLPNLSGLIVSLVTLTFAATVTADAALSYLGLGIPPPTATLGSLINAGQSGLTSGHWWLLILPAVALTALIAAVSSIGTWLGQRLDPRTGRRGGSSAQPSDPTNVQPAEQSSTTTIGASHV